MSVLMKGYAAAVTGHVGSIKRALNESGWLDEDVIAAGELRQGKPLSVAGMISGTAVFELARRRSKALPRHFVLAITQQRVVAFRAISTGDDNDSQTEAHTVRIRPGECGAWPRACVRIVDLPDGAQSAGGTLELSETERVPVATMGGDPNTDELISVLGGGVLGLSDGSPIGSPKRQRRLANRESLLRASSVDSADDATYAADAARGRPDFDLTGWAGRRGLSFRGSPPQGGHLSVTCPWSEELLFNVVRGNWSSGSYGVLCHEARLYEDDARGYFRGSQEQRVGDNMAGFLLDSLMPIPLPLGGQGQQYFKVPYTSVGTRVPHLATLTGLHVRWLRRATLVSRCALARERGGSRPVFRIGAPGTPHCGGGSTD